MKNTPCTPFSEPAQPDARMGAGWSVVRVLFLLFFGDPIGKMLRELDALFAAWRAGTLAPVQASAPAPGQATPEIPLARPAHPPIAHAPRAYARRSAASRGASQAESVREATAQPVAPQHDLPPDWRPTTRHNLEVPTKNFFSRA